MSERARARERRRKSCAQTDECVVLCEGPYNLATKMCRTAVPPDLGPKGYIAYGRENEVAHMMHDGLAGGDSVTKLHEDMSDAVRGEWVQEGGAESARVCVFVCACACAPVRVYACETERESVCA